MKKIITFIIIITLISVSMANASTVSALTHKQNDYEIIYKNNHKYRVDYDENGEVDTITELPMYKDNEQELKDMLDDNVSLKDMLKLNVSLKTILDEGGF